MMLNGDTNRLDVLPRRNESTGQVRVRLRLKLRLRVKDKLRGRVRFRDFI